MSEKTKTIKPILITAVILFIFLFLIGLVIPWMGLLIHLETRPDPPTPEITYAEFPFTLVYKLNGKEIVYKDVVIGEYSGVGNDMGHDEKYRMWTKRYKSGKETITLLELENGKYIKYTLRFSAEYLMGDNESDNYRRFSNACFLETPRGIVSGQMMYDSCQLTDEQLLDDYGIEIISFEIAPPIKNTFIPVE